MSIRRPRLAFLLATFALAACSAADPELLRSGEDGDSDGGAGNGTGRTSARDGGAGSSGGSGSGSGNGTTSGGTDGTGSPDGGTPSTPDGAAPDAAPVVYGNPLAGNPTVTKVMGGFEFLEGPLWLEAEGKLLFSDVPQSKIHVLTPPSSVTIFRTPSGRTNGIAHDPLGRLVGCEGERHRVARTEADGGATVVANLFEGKQLNSSNDIIVRSDGTVYFTDPKWGADEANRQPFQGVFRVTPAGVVSTLARDMTNPNGIALSPDEKTLYVSDDLDNFVRAFPLRADGSAGTPTRFTATSQTPDGMAVDLAGNLYVTTQAGVEVYRPDASKIGTIAVPEIPSNASFGGPDKKTLYITARTSLYSARVGVPGKP